MLIDLPQTINRRKSGSALLTMRRWRPVATSLATGSVCRRCLSTLPPPPAVERRRVVVTGLGCVTPLGVGAEESWRQLLAGGCGIKSLEGEEYQNLPTNLAACVPRGDGPHMYRESDWLKKGESRTVPEFAAYALAAAQQAFDDAGWRPETAEERQYTGVSMGVGMVALDEIYQTGVSVASHGARKVSPYFVPRILINMAAGHISMRFGLNGPNHAVSTACATGAHAIGDAFRMVRDGAANVMVAGGTEACVGPISIAGFSRAKALSTAFNGRPSLASRPFDKDRDGFVIGEGAGAVVLEEYEHARRRGARIYCETRGYGLSGDAYHMTAPSPEALGARLSMGMALRQAGLEPNQIDYINAHATSTPMGDNLEVLAIKSVFGEHASQLAVSSSKGAIGHLLGAAGAVEAIFAIKAVHENVCPPTLNFAENEDPGNADMNFVPNAPQNRVVNAALTNSFGFGGTNASLCFAKIS